MDVTITHRDFLVMCSDAVDPNPHWTKDHVAQGFAIRPGAVAFSTILDGDTIFLEVEIGDGCGQFSAEARRVIQVPFEVSRDAEVWIITIVTEARIDVPPGQYTLQVDQGVRPDATMWGRLLFCPGDGTARVLKADAEITRVDDFLMTSESV